MDHGVTATQAAWSAAVRVELADGGDTESGATDWKRAHEELVRLATLRASLDWDEGRWLVSALRFGAHLRLGFGNFLEYVERLFGYRPRFTQEKLRVAEALEELPELEHALREGQLGWSVVRELTRVATRNTEKLWIDAARGRTVRDVEKLISGRKPGDRPNDKGTAGATRHTLRFEVSGEALATFREAMAKLRRDANGRLDDDAALLSMARVVLGGPTDCGKSSYQLSLTVCERCRRGFQQGSGELVEVSAEVVAMADCDAQNIGRAHVGTNVEASASVEAQNLGRRATQTVPPAVRRRVIQRDGGKCAVPGCRHSQYLDVHHVNPRAEGGDHNPEYLVTLCGVHHRAVHGGRLVITGSFTSGFRFRHADGTSYGTALLPHACEAREKAFLGLRKLGFSETEARRALETALGQSGAEVTTEGLLRRALAAFRPAPGQ